MLCEGGKASREDPLLGMWILDVSAAKSDGSMEIAQKLLPHRPAVTERVRAPGKGQLEHLRLVEPVSPSQELWSCALRAPQEC